MNLLGIKLKFICKFNVQFLQFCPFIFYFLLFILNRNYGAIGTDIDSLRNPVDKNNFCRGASKGKVSKITLEQGKPHTITLAFSNGKPSIFTLQLGAQHIGPCVVEIIDANDLNKVVQITSGQCARNPIAP